MPPFGVGPVECVDSQKRILAHAIRANECNERFVLDGQCCFHLLRPGCPTEDLAVEIERSSIVLPVMG